jgi:serine/threonine-protein kinase
MTGCGKRATVTLICIVRSSLLANHHDATSAEGWPAAAAQLIIKPALLEPGQYVGHYQITSFLAAGGMGEVYRARDSKLKRDVALKVLPEAFARDPGRMARFRREAEVLASLNHPNIAAIYDIQEANGSRFLILEFIEGETLADRIACGPIPVADALQIAKNICEALEAAHEKGIIHRDLKPANVKITPEGKVKVLDFGLAKVLEVAPAQAASNSPTLLSGAAISGGVVLGTAGYMSPEQAKGHSADQRSDIFSFGCVLYEMLTGHQAFHAETVTESIAAILMREPDLNALPTNLHPKIEELIRRCLAKNRKERWHAVADVRFEIAAILAESQGLKTADAGVARTSRWRFGAIIAGTAAAAALATSGIERGLRPKLATAPIARFSFVLPEGQIITRGGRHAITISPDGQNIVYQANQQLYLRPMSDIDAKPIQGTNVDAANPFFSPDGQWIGFYSVAERSLKKIAITGGAAVTLAKVAFPFGASWTADNQILLADQRLGILRVSADGSKPETLIAAKDGEVMHGPQLLPDGDHVLFTVHPAMGRTTTRGTVWDKAQIVVHSLKTGVRKPLIDGGTDARYVPTGHLVYALGATLFAVPFDAMKLEKTGGPVRILDGILRSSLASGAAHFGFAASGTMVYFAGNGVRNAETKVGFVNLGGGKKMLPLPPGLYREPRISPDGKQAALLAEDEQGNQVLSVYDLSQTTALLRLTFQSSDFPVWTQDGRIIFSSDGTLFSQRADGNGAAEILATPDQPGTY